LKLAIEIYDWTEGTISNRGASCLCIQLCIYTLWICCCCSYFLVYEWIPFRILRFYALYLTITAHWVLRFYVYVVRVRYTTKAVFIFDPAIPVQRSNQLSYRVQLSRALLTARSWIYNKGDANVMFIAQNHVFTFQTSTVYRYVRQLAVRKRWFLSLYVVIIQSNFSCNAHGSWHAVDQQLLPSLLKLYWSSSIQSAIKYLRQTLKSAWWNSPRVSARDLKFIKLHFSLLFQCSWLGVINIYKFPLDNFHL
jgi:hypothetical protein